MKFTLEISESELISVLKSKLGASANVDLDFGEVTDEDDEYCCCGVPQNQHAYTGVISNLDIEQDFIELDMPNIANPLRIYLRGTARIFFRVSPLIEGDRISVIARFEPQGNGACKFYSYNDYDIHKVNAEAKLND